MAFIANYLKSCVAAYFSVMLSRDMWCSDFLTWSSPTRLLSLLPCLRGKLRCKMVLDT